MMLALYLLGARRDPERRGAIARLAPWFLAGPLLVLAGGILDEPARTILWTASLAVDVAGTFRAASGGWRVSPAHFAERYGLFIIIALGESMVAIGATAAGHPIEGILVMAVTLAMAGAMALWWAYFDFAARGMERALRAVHGRARSDLARDMFTILHYPLVLGIILYAVAAKTTVAHPSEPLSQTGLIALSAGVAAFLLGSVAIRWRGIHVVAGERFVAGMVIPGGLILLRELPAVALMAVAVAALALAVGVETSACAPFGPRSGRPDGVRRAARCPPAQRGDPRRRTRQVSTKSRIPARRTQRSRREVRTLAAWRRRRITSGSPYERTVGFSRAIRVGDRVLVSGTAPIWPDGSCDPDPGVQAARCLRSSWPRWPRPGRARSTSSGRAATSSTEPTRQPVTRPRPDLQRHPAGEHDDRGGGAPRPALEGRDGGRGDARSATEPPA